MEGSALSTIFSGAPPRRVQLPRTPLVRVLCQVRFSPILSIRSEDRIAGFQDAIRQEYPKLNREHAQTINIGPGAQGPPSESFIWRFDDPEHGYRTSLSTDFLTVETTAYTSREDFLSRLARVLEALAATDVAPGNVTRVGVRYVDRVLGDNDVREVSQLVRPEVKGMLALMVEGAADLKQTVQESLIRHEESAIRTRVAFLPPRATVDPNIIPPVDEPSWVLDIDAFREGDLEFTAKETAGIATELADKCHRVFHWAVTPEFLRYFGGDV